MASTQLTEYWSVKHQEEGDDQANLLSEIRIGKEKFSYTLHTIKEPDKAIHFRMQIHAQGALAVMAGLWNLEGEEWSIIRVWVDEETGKAYTVQTIDTTDDFEDEDDFVDDEEDDFEDDDEDEVDDPDHQLPY